MDEENKVKAEEIFEDDIELYKIEEIEVTFDDRMGIVNFLKNASKETIAQFILALKEVKYEVVSTDDDGTFSIDIDAIDKQTFAALCSNENNFAFSRKK